MEILCDEGAFEMSAKYAMFCPSNNSCREHSIYLILARIFFINLIIAMTAESGLPRQVCTAAIQPRLDSRPCRNARLLSTAQGSFSELAVPLMYVVDKEGVEEDLPFSNPLLGKVRMARSGGSKMFLDVQAKKQTYTIHGVLQKLIKTI